MGFARGVVSPEMLSASPMTMMAALTFSTNAVSTSTMPLPQNGSPPFASARRHKNSLSLSLSSLSFCHARVFLKALSLAYLGDFFCLSLETLKKRKEKCRGMPLFCCSTTPLLNASKKNSSRFRHNINARALLELSTGHLCIHSPPLFGGTH